MNLLDTSLKDVYIISNDPYADNRGTFYKYYHSDSFSSVFNGKFVESFYSVSHLNVLRGMHFQLSPFSHWKLVTVFSGCILDVVVNIDKDSEDFGRFLPFYLKAAHQSLLIRPSYAHGFLSLEDSSVVNYLTSSVYSQEHDSGIHWNSFGFDWGGISPIISKRDSTFPPLMDI